ncbi:hypothetical protein LOK49_LG13G00366 [Camellia lanceoleosa]|uniref:Uncharacterized protein n=1 Tax=Camellia lanceoleosa TaxID=1840588 RepID=A0ACC0FJU0_9ERIC|nr:hypothetical protein LOK49_LG13G00366 [Camellia lanceoleosa]
METKQRTPLKFLFPLIYAPVLPLNQISTILRANEPADGGSRKPWLTAILKHLPVCRYHMRLDTPATT